TTGQRLDQCCGGQAGTAADAGSLAGGFRVPVAVGRRARVVPADQTTNVCASADDLTGRIGLADRAVPIGADQTTHFVLPVDRAHGIGFAERAVFAASNKAAYIAAAADGTAGIRVGDAAGAEADQTADVRRASDSAGG